MNKVAGCYHYLSTAGMNLVWQDLCAGCYKSFPHLHQSLIPVEEPTDSPVITVKQDQSRGSHGVTQCWGCWGSPWALFTHWKNQSLMGDRSTWIAWPGEGQCGQCVVTSLTLLMQFVLSLWCKGLLHPHLCVLGFSQQVRNSC